MDEMLITISKADYEVAKKEIFEEMINDESLKGTAKAILPMLILILADKLKRKLFKEENNE